MCGARNVQVGRRVGARTAGGKHEARADRSQHSSGMAHGSHAA
jgi:hypothetical protein